MRNLAILAITAALMGVSTPPSSGQEVAGAGSVTGAGSTFAFPIVARWAKGYERWVAGGGDIPIAGSGLDDPPPRVVLDYEPVGSLAGAMRARDASVDFGASDMPLKSDELRKLGLVQFPIVIGGIVAVVNIDGVAPGQLKVTGPLLADIFLGKIQSWSDSAIKALNPGLNLPDARISVVRREDGSGTTFNFTNYLSRVSPQWGNTVGSDLIVKWPTGMGGRGNNGVSGLVRQTRNSIGYVEYAHALQTKLSYVSIQNRNGQFVVPSPDSFRVTAATADWASAGDFDLLMIDVPRDGAYPIVATVFVLMRKSASPARTRAALNFFEWSLDRGARDAADLGYIPLPPELVTQVKSYWTATLRKGS